MGTKIDSITLNIVGKNIINVAREMNLNLIKTAYSSIIREVQDASSAIMDANGEIVAQSESMPIHLNSISEAFKGCLEKYEISDIKPEDIIITNDPYYGGQHLPDIFVYTPIFYGNQLIGFTCSVGHHLDVGGGGASSLNPNANDIFSEGFVIPRLKLRGKNEWDLFKEIFSSNIRIPYITMGDLQSQLIANESGKVRILELIENYELDTILNCMNELKNYSERITRKEISKVPDGIYTAEVLMDGVNKEKEFLRIAVSIIINGSDMIVDFSGTDSQVDMMINSPLAATEAAVYTAAKCLLTSAKVPANEGCNKPIKVIVPEGSILNPLQPRPVRGRVNTANRAFDVVIKAMSIALPERVIASGFDTSLLITLSYRTDEGISIFTEPIRGGYGASYRNDGANQVGTPLDNCTNTPVEAAEQIYPFFYIKRYELLEDSSGIGKYFGSQGAIREFEILKDGVVFSFFGDRFKTSAFGLFGGGRGTCGSVKIIRNGKTTSFPTTIGTCKLEKGDLLQVVVGGGGGYGNFEERPKKYLQKDLKEERITEKLYNKLVKNVDTKD